VQHDSSSVLAMATNTLHNALCITHNLFKNLRLRIAIVRSAWRQPNISKHTFPCHFIPAVALNTGDATRKLCRIIMKNVVLTAVIAIHHSVKQIKLETGIPNDVAVNTKSRSRLIGQSWRSAGIQPVSRNGRS